EQLMFDGFKYTPVEPDYLDARNAILTADAIRYGGADINALWTAFAARGMGSSASVSPGSFDDQPLLNGWETVVFAAYDTPSSPYPANKSVILTEDFEGSVAGWTTAGVDGAGGGPLWHLSAGALPAAAKRSITARKPRETTTPVFETTVSCSLRKSLYHRLTP